MQRKQLVEGMLHPAEFTINGHQVYEDNQYQQRHDGLGQHKMFCLLEWSCCMPEDQL